MPFKKRKPVDPAVLEGIIGDFQHSGNPRDILVGDELHDAYYNCYPDEPYKAVGDGIARMDEFIRAARLARTKLRRLL